MGCDIHPYIEIQKDGVWTFHDWKAPYKTGVDEDGDPNYDYDRLWDDPLDINRNYNLFAILADVRNGRGFAGIKTGEGFIPISQPKGLPKNVSKEVKHESDEYGRDGHSHSYLTVQELLAYNWEQKTKHYGTVDAEQFKIFKKKGKPDSWAGSVVGQSVRHLTHYEMEEAIAIGRTKDAYTSVEWTEPYSASVGKFLTQTIPALQKLGDPENVRIVFFFDN